MKFGRRPRYRLAARAEKMAATRARIVGATLRLALAQAYEDITLAGIAAAAGVSHQTVLNHFDSKEGAAAAAAARLGRQTMAARDRAPAGDARRALAVLVGEYERIGDANARWAMSAERLGTLAPLLDEARAGHQAWLARVFAADLPAASAPRRRAIQALHAATDVYVWKLLRRDLKLSRPETEAVMRDLVQGVLAAPGGPRRRTRRRGQPS